MSSDSLCVAIAEDEPLNRERLVRLLRNSGCEVLLLRGRRCPAGMAGGPDAVFLDIQMPGPGGLEVLERIPDPILVVFMTAHSDYAVKAFDFEAVDYQLNPVRSERLAWALLRIREAQTQSQARHGLAVWSSIRFPVKARVLGQPCPYDVENPNCSVPLLSIPGRTGHSIRSFVT